MGYLNNSSVTVDAILTTKGREMLAKNGKLDITHFALGDDEIDYTLWNPAHPLGSNYYGIIIENLPLVEAIPDETQNLRSKLITIPKTGTTQIIGIPFISVQQDNFTKAEANIPIELSPITKYVDGTNKVSTTTLNQTLGYTAVLSDTNLGSLAATMTGTQQTDGVGFAGDMGTKTISVVGTKFTFTPSVNNTSVSKTATITITGNESGGVKTIRFTIPPTTTTVVNNV